MLTSFKTNTASPALDLTRTAVLVFPETTVLLVLKTPAIQSKASVFIARFSTKTASTA